MTFIQSIIQSFQHDGLFIQIVWGLTALIVLFYLFVAVLILIDISRRVQLSIQSNREARLRLKKKKPVSYPIDPTRDGLY